MKFILIVKIGHLGGSNRNLLLRNNLSDNIDNNSKKYARFSSVVSVVHGLAAFQHERPDVELAYGSVVLCGRVAEALDDFPAAVERRRVGQQQRVQLLCQFGPDAALHGKGAVHEVDHVPRLVGTRPELEKRKHTIRV